MKLFDYLRSTSTRCFVVLALLSFTPAVRGQEQVTQYQFYGFSDDARYCAFEVFGEATSEGSPPASTFFFIDNDKNDYAARPVLLIDSIALNMDLATVRTTNRKKADPLFKKFGISGTNPGKRVVFRRESQPYGDDVSPVQSFNVGTQRYTLTLSTVPTGQSLNDRAEVMAVVDLDHNGNKVNLQKATKAPKSWGFIIGYSFLDAYHSSGRLAVFLEYLGPGFEGYPDKHQMIVTGKLN